MFAAALFDAFQGAGQEVFTASILGFAVVMLTWHVGWMSHHGREMAAEMREVGKAVRLGHRSLAALAVVVAVAVMREGSEVVLFLFGIAARHQTRRRCRWRPAASPDWHWPARFPGCCIADW